MSTHMAQKRKAFPPRGFETTASPPPMLQNVFFSNGIPYTFQNGTAFFQPPQLQAAPMPAAPDAPMYPGSGYGPAQGPSQTYAPAMMYPCANPAPMFLSPQYQQYQPMPMSNPHQLMYTSTIQTLNNGADTPSPIPMSPHGTPPFFVSQGEMRPEMYYMPPSTGQPHPYSTPMMLTTVPDPSVQYCEIASDQPNANVPNEVMPQPIPEENVPSQEQTEAPNLGVANQEESSELQSNTETPIVSLRNLQKIDESDNRGGRYRSNRHGGHGRTSDVQNNAAPQGDHNERGVWRRSRGSRGNYVAIPKFPPYLANNNNPSVTNNNNYKTGDHGGRGGYRGNGVGRSGYRMNGGRRIIIRSSTPPNDPYNSSFPNVNLNSNQFQIAQQQQQAFMAGRSMQLPYHPASAHHTAVVAAGGGNAAQQQVHAHYNSVNAHHPSPPPPQSNVPPRRYNNMAATNRRTNQNNNNHYSTRKRGEIDNGAAGDAPVQNHEAPPSTPDVSKGSPPPTVTSTDQEHLCSAVKNLSVQ